MSINALVPGRKRCGLRVWRIIVTKIEIKEASPLSLPPSTPLSSLSSSPALPLATALQEGGEKVEKNKKWQGKDRDEGAEELGMREKKRKEEGSGRERGRKRKE